MKQEIQGICAQLTRKRIKNLYIQIKDGKVFIRAPFNMKMEEINQFVSKRADWINSKLSSSHPPPETSFENGDKVLVLGKQYELEVKHGKSNFMLAGDIAILTSNKNDAKKRELIYLNYLNKILVEKIELYLKLWQQKTGLHCVAWDIRNMRSQWGNCDVLTKKLRFNINLAKKHPEFISYVVLHEVAHLKIKGHGNDFKTYLSSYLPDWKEINKKYRI